MLSKIIVTRNLYPTFSQRCNPWVLVESFTEDLSIEDDFIIFCHNEGKKIYSLIDDLKSENLHGKVILFNCSEDEIARIKCHAGNKIQIIDAYYAEDERPEIYLTPDMKDLFPVFGEYRNDIPWIHVSNSMSEFDNIKIGYRAAIEATKVLIAVESNEVLKFDSVDQYTNYKINNLSYDTLKEILNDVVEISNALVKNAFVFDTDNVLPWLTHRNSYLQILLINKSSKYTMWDMLPIDKKGYNQYCSTLEFIQKYISNTQFSNVSTGFINFEKLFI